MKVKKLFLLNLLILSGFASQAQNVASNASRTSGGLQAGNSGTGNTFYGYQAGLNTTGNHNVFIGHQLKNNASAGRSVNIGFNSNINNGGVSIGYQNYTNGGIVIGSESNASGGSIVFGQRSYASGSQNIFIGSEIGDELGTSSSNNIIIGHRSAMEKSLSTNNIYLGNGVGFQSVGNRCIFIGDSAGSGVSGHDLLFIENSDSDKPLIWGNFATDQLKFNGKVGVGYGFGVIPTTAGTFDINNYNLFVNGGILTEEVRIMLKHLWADYVFEEDYDLPSLSEVEQFIKENKHLPNVPTAKEIQQNGIELGEITVIQQEKIEELTLYLIEQQKEINMLKEKLETLLEKIQ